MLVVMVQEKASDVHTPSLLMSIARSPRSKDRSIVAVKLSSSAGGVAGVTV